MKLNEGVSGDGNARVDLRDLPAPGAEGEAAAIGARLHELRFERRAPTLDRYLAKLDLAAVSSKS